MTTKCALWIAVSTDRQEGANQVPDMERLAAKLGYEIAERYTLSESRWNGGKDNGEYKALLKKAMDDAWQDKFSVLIIWALDRMTREGAEGALRIFRQFKERGCTVLSHQESWLNGSPEVQDILISFAGWAAKQESDRKSARVKAALARRKAEGKPVGRIKGAKDKTPKSRKRSGYVSAWEGPASEARKAALAERNRARASGAS
jgi:putative DNA-invertase from lambdoid prophage Rac